jgi:hypothetical protein
MKTKATKATHHRHIAAALRSFAWTIREAEALHGAHTGGPHERNHAARIILARRHLRYLKTGKGMP